MGRQIGADLSMNLAPESTPEIVRVLDVSFDSHESSAEGELRREMWTNVGLVRNELDLKGSSEVLADLASMATSQRARVMTYVAKLVVEAALLRRENRGAHFRSDEVPEPQDTSPVVTAPVELRAIRTS